MCAETPDYKTTLNLPKTDFPMRAGLPKVPTDDGQGRAIYPRLGLSRIAD